MVLHSFETGCLMCTGDLIAQTIVEGKKFKDVDKMRSAHFFTLGVGIVVRKSRFYFVSLIPGKKC